MEKTRCYIGAPSGVVVCIDQADCWHMVGRFYNRYSRQETVFCNTEQLLIRLEQLFDAINFPRATTAQRSFGEKRLLAAEKGERTAVMRDEELLKKHGELGTFVVRVQHRQNSSWQGKVTWIEGNKSLHFRSVWELIKLVESALNANGELDQMEKAPDWFLEEE